MLLWPGAAWPEWVRGVIVSLALNLDKRALGYTNIISQVYIHFTGSHLDDYCMFVRYCQIPRSRCVYSWV